MELRSLSYASWAVIASVGAATVLSYSAVAEYFPKEVAGQANAALNVLHIGGAFFLQQAIGVIVANWPCQDGHYPSVAYKVAFALVVVLQLAAIMWFMRWDQKIAAVLRTYALAHLGTLRNKGGQNPALRLRQRLLMYLEEAVGSTFLTLDGGASRFSTLPPCFLLIGHLNRALHPL